MSLATLRNLVNHSLIRVDANERYSMHELWRRFSYEKLDAFGEVQVLGEAHCNNIFAWLEQLRVTPGNDHEAWAACDANYGQVRAALSWAADTRDTERLLRLAN